ncbi:uncharacterized protein [Panulirus ornatus]|uniref:uncharacterized protein n=1 Tax=Panulirus ornatus TaxID=150431 RepID=UPI003A892C2C
MVRRKQSTYTLLYTWAAVLTLLEVRLARQFWGGLPLAPTAHSTPPHIHPSSSHSSSTPVCRRCFRQYLRQPVTWRDERLVRHLRSSMESLPQLPRQRLHPHIPPWSHIPSYNATEDIIRKLFQEKVGGVFVEVGAQDGLWLSNTWWLEAARGWRGLLLEADPHNYLQLRSSPRTSTTLPVCVTTDLIVKKEVMVRSRSPNNITETVYRTQQGKSKLLKYATKSDINFGETWTTTCYPLLSVLTAARYDQVDLLILDISGGGYEMTIDFLSMNKALGNPFFVKVILYQDNELPQFFSLEDVRDGFKKYGYNLIKIRQNHYLLHHNSMNVAVV